MYSYVLVAFGFIASAAPEGNAEVSWKLDAYDNYSLCHYARRDFERSEDFFTVFTDCVKLKNEDQEDG